MGCTKAGDGVFLSILFCFYFVKTINHGKKSEFLQSAILIQIVRKCRRTVKRLRHRGCASKVPKRMKQQCTRR